MRRTLMAALLFFWVQSTWTHAGEPGNAFTDPDLIWQRMPSGWIGQTVRPEPDAAKADLAVTLDQQLYAPLLPHIREFAEERELKIAVSEGTCGIAAGLLSRKAIDIGGFCCPPGPTDRLPGLRFYTLGIAAIALFVHADGPVDDLSLQQARRIFSGKIADWSALGDHISAGGSKPIHVIGRLHCKQRPGHWRLLLAQQDLFSPDLLEVGTIKDMIGSVATDPLAIGYETLWMVHRYRGSRELKILSLNGVRPEDSVALARGRYPLYRVYSVTTWEGAAAKTLAQELVHHLQDRMMRLDAGFFMVPALKLRENGWRFQEDELIGEPD